MKWTHSRSVYSDVARIYVDEVNRQILQSVAEQGQADLVPAKQFGNCDRQRHRCSKTIPRGNVNTANKLMSLRKISPKYMDNYTFRSGFCVLISPFTVDAFALSKVQFILQPISLPSGYCFALAALSITLHPYHCSRKALRDHGIVQSSSHHQLLKLWWGNFSVSIV